MTDQRTLTPLESTSADHQSTNTTGYELFADSEKLKLEDEFVKVTARVVDGESIRTLNDGDPAVDKRELRHIMETCCAHATASVQHGVKMNKRKYLIRKRGNSDQDLKRMRQSRYRVAVIIWKGLGFAAPLTSWDFQKLCEGDHKITPTLVPDWDPRKFWLPEDHKSGHRWRWSLIALFDANTEQNDVDDWLIAVERLFKDEYPEYEQDAADLHDVLYTGHIGIEITTEDFVVADLVDRTRSDTAAPARDYFEAKEDQDMMHALLKLYYNGRESLAVHGNKFFDADVAESVEVGGVLCCAGKTRVLAQLQSGQAAVTDLSCTRPFLPAYDTVADFLRKRYPLHFADTTRPWPAAACTEALRNMRVYVPEKGNPKRHKNRRILSVPGTACSTITSEDQHRQWPSHASTLNQTLPLIDVGSDYRPRLVPAEVCVILPMQSFKGALTPDMEQALKRTRPEVSLSSKGDVQTRTTRDIRAPIRPKQAPLVSAKTLTATSGGEKQRASGLAQAQPSSEVGVTPTKTAAPPTDEKNSPLSTRIGVYDDIDANDAPYFLFVVPIANGTDDGIWQQFSYSLLQGAKAPGSRSSSKATSPKNILTFSESQQGPQTKSEIADRKLCLRYDADALKLAEEYWPNRLATFVDLHRGRPGGIVVVICMPSYTVSAALYKIIKRTCDLRLGVQSVSMTQELLQKKLDQSSRRGAQQTAYGIARRQIAASTAPALEEGSELSELAVAMHVTQAHACMEFEYSRHRTEAQSLTVYIVALVSRSMTSSEGYRTEVKIFHKDEYESVEGLQVLANMLKTFTGCVANAGKSEGCKITVFRSGCLSKFASKPATSPALYGNAEHESLKSALDGDAELSYITLSKAFVPLVSLKGLTVAPKSVDRAPASNIAKMIF